jgi:hypothetical protein
LYFNGGKIVETESEGVTGGNIAEQTDRHQRWVRCQEPNRS